MQKSVTTNTKTAKNFSTNAQQNLIAGADNLLCKCMGVKRGEQVLLVLEPDNTLYDPTLSDIIEQRVGTLGASCCTVKAELISQAEQFPEDISTLMRTSQHTLFLSRLGDYVRFAHLPGECTKTTSYALNPAMLASPYASTCHNLLKQLLDKLEHELMQAEHWHISCALGTNIEGTFCWPSLQGGRDDEINVTLFPIATFKPVPCKTARGQVALSKWLLPGGAAKLADAELTIPEPVMCHVKEGLISDFTGSAEPVRQVRQHYNYVASQLNITRDRVHSWHLGINPQTWFDGRAEEQLDQWCAVSFGSPRYLHFHTCGDEPPGEIAWSVFNPTVKIDGETYWQDGQFIWLNRGDNQKLINQVNNAASLLQPSLSIGI